MHLLEKAVLLEKDADAFGFRWENTTQIMAQIKSECEEIQEHLDLKEIQNSNRLALQEEIGDLFHAVLSLCVYCQFDPQETMQNALNKFERRLLSVKQIAQKQGITNLKGYAFDELMQFWDQAKRQVG